jgi:hypothetical protein
MTRRINMKRFISIALIAGLAASGAAPAAAQDDPQVPATKPVNAKVKAYGKYCKTQSKKRVKGEKGTPFSQCVRAMAKADREDSLGARAACKELSKKRVEGQKGTPFSRCVVGVAQMRKDQESETTG